MESHTIILTTPRVPVPEIKIMEFVQDLIKSNSMNVDYFGVELDNQADYLDEAMKKKIADSLNVTIHFEKDNIDYNSYNDENTLSLSLELLNHLVKGKTIVEDNEIEIYVH